MSTGTFFQVILAAVMHAAWNVYARRIPGNTVILLWFGQLVTAALILAVTPHQWQLIKIEQGWWLPVVVSSLLHALYIISLGLAYNRSHVSQVYPVARGVGILGTFILAGLANQEQLSTAGMVGVLLIVPGVFLLGGGAKGLRATGNSGGALFLSVWTGVLISGYSVVDNSGVEYVPPFLFLGLISLGSTLLMVPYILHTSGKDLPAVLKQSGWSGPAIGLVSLTTYYLILDAFRSSPASYVVALREFSIVVAFALGVGLLKEPVSWSKGAGVTLIIAGAGILKLA